MQILKERVLLKGKIFYVTDSVLKDKCGKEFSRQTVVHPGAVAIIPQISKDKIILVRQYRFPTRRYLWELPAGTLDKGEAVYACAKRELREETGCVAGQLRKIAEFYTCPGFCTEKIHLFIAHCRQTAAQKLDPDEQITCKIFTRRQIKGLLKAKKIIDAKSLIGLMIWLQPEKI